MQTHLDGLEETERVGVLQLVGALASMILDSEIAVPRRLSFFRTLKAIPSAGASALIQVADSDEEISLKLAALDALSASRNPEIGPKLLASFDAQTPQLKRAMLDVMLSDEARTAGLLEALEKGTMKPTEIDITRQARLTKHRNMELAARANKLFAAAVSPDRNAVMAKYQPAIDKKGDALRGRAIFEKNCVTCHRVDNIGVNVGPDIGDTRDKTPAYLLTNILDPNRAVDANYFGYTLITKQGKVLTGLVKSETASSITIRLPEGKEETILRTDVDELKSSGLSLMPVGVEKTITVEQMADLIAFLKNWRYLDGSVPLAE
jgi:putative heme-binding domain-containing protein